MDQVLTLQPPPCRRPTTAPKAMNAKAMITFFTIASSSSLKRRGMTRYVPLRSGSVRARLSLP